MFKPNFIFSKLIVNSLVQIEQLRKEIEGLPITPKILALLRKTARLRSTHYSTQIEGNRLTEQEVEQTIQEHTPLTGRDRDQKEVLGYYQALEHLERLVQTTKNLISEKEIQLLHGLVMGGGKKKAIPTPYRVDQNVIRESLTRRIVYLPPEPKDVSELMVDLVVWINQNGPILSAPLIAAIAHYQFATIHPYLDGNGRTVRLLATLVLYRSDHALKGIYSLEEYYAKDLQAYYDAISIGPSHNYYEGRAEADITPWVEYFCSGMVQSFENVRNQMSKVQYKGVTDQSYNLRRLEPRQRLVFELFEQQAKVTVNDIAKFLAIDERAARLLCQKWVKENFLVLADSSKKARKYALAPEYEQLITQ